ncbi:DOMON-like domain-containing protein [Parasphingorhabdus sp.]|uniref:DOMON-like domain-containing protein n=1 Tax=Parasphingorhabdus sp. TaxID=2709688 RepID=UPI003C781F7D
MPLKLSCHPYFSADAVRTINVSADCLPSGRLLLRYNLLGAVDQLKLPEPSLPERIDSLWQKTCFEAFIAVPDAPGYLELNLSPSTQWAVYAFEGYRMGKSNPEVVSAPRIEVSTTAGNFELVATADLSGLTAMEAASLEIALAAVIEERNGRKSYWALNHPLGNPDFHDRDCFTHKLETMDSR